MFHMGVLSPPTPNFHFTTGGKYAYFRAIPFVPPHPTFYFMVPYFPAKVWYQNW